MVEICWNMLKLYKFPLGIRPIWPGANLLWKISISERWQCDVDFDTPSVYWNWDLLINWDKMLLFQGPWSSRDALAAVNVSSWSWNDGRQWRMTMWRVNFWFKTCPKSDWFKNSVPCVQQKLETCQKGRQRKLTELAVIWFDVKNACEVIWYDTPNE